MRDFTNIDLTDPFNLGRAHAAARHGDESAVHALRVHRKANPPAKVIPIRRNTTALDAGRARARARFGTGGSDDAA